MRPIHALAIVLAFAASSVAAAGPSAEPAHGRGAGPSEWIVDARGGSPASAELVPSGTRRALGIGYGSLRGGNGIRISNVADSAFGVPLAGARPAPGNLGQGRGEPASR
jgi:hypothetical protein